MTQIDAAFAKLIQNTDVRSAAAGFFTDLGHLLKDPTVDRNVLGHQLLISAEDLAGALVRGTPVDDNKPFGAINQVSTVLGHEPDPFKLPEISPRGGDVIQGNTVVTPSTTSTTPSSAPATGQPSQHPSAPSAPSTPPAAAPASPATAPATPSTAPVATPSVVPSKAPSKS